jgi:hypothetical protein
MDGIVMNLADVFTVGLCLTFVGTFAIAIVYAMRLLSVG